MGQNIQERISHAHHTIEYNLNRAVANTEGESQVRHPDRCAPLLRHHRQTETACNAPGGWAPSLSPDHEERAASHA